MSEAVEADQEADTSEDTPDETPADTEDLTTEPGGFKCIAEQSALVDYFEAFDTLADEMKLTVAPEGFESRAVDPANVAMIADDLPADAFDHYSSTGGVLGLHLNRMLDVLGCGSTGDLVQFELEQKTRKLHISIGGLSYTLALIDPDSVRPEPDIPDLDLAAEIVVSTEQIERGLTAADMVSDHVRLRVADGGDTFVIEAEGDTDDVDLKLDAPEDVEIRGDEADSLFSLDYLKDMKDAFPAGGDVRIELGNEFPAKFHFDHVEIDGESQADATMLLAPRISSE